jgi:hypothetical protein
MKKPKVIKITRWEVKEIINKIPFTAFFGVVFKKIDGSTRKMNCNRSISTGLRNQKKPFKVELSSVQVFDVNVKKDDGTKGGFRQVNLNTLSEITFGGVRYLVV